MRSAAAANVQQEGKVDPNADGMEHLGAARRQRRFGRDLRLKEVRASRSLEEEWSYQLD